MAEKTENSEKTDIKGIKIFDEYYVIWNDSSIDVYTIYDHILLEIIKVELTFIHDVAYKNDAFIISGKLYSEYKLLIWNFKNKKIVNEIIVDDKVNTIFVKRDLIIAIFKDKVECYSYSGKITSTFGTCDNPLGIGFLANNAVFATLGTKIGKVFIKFKNRNYTINTFDTDISCISMNKDATLLAVTDGSVIKIYDTESTSKLFEFRRGLYDTIVYNMVFTSTGLLCTCSSGTVHFFDFNIKKAEIVSNDTVIHNVFSEAYNKLLTKGFLNPKSALKFRTEELNIVTKCSQLVNGNILVLLYSGTGFILSNELVLMNKFVVDKI